MKTTTVKVVKPFVYLVNNNPQWITPEAHPTFKLPTHAANELVRQQKVSITESDQDK